MDKTKESPNRGPSRRKFLAGMGALTSVGAAAIITGCGGGGSSSVAPQVPPKAAFTDTDYLNFALNLEFLEAAIYLRATSSAPLPVDVFGSPVVTGGTPVQFVTPTLKEYANEIALDELKHVRFLLTTIKALGAVPVACPAINFTDAFTALASAAGIVGPFNPFLDENSFLLGAFVFEDVGVTAYNGAIPQFATKPPITAAGGIMAVEAYHAAEIRLTIYETSLGTAGPTLLADANKISDLRAKLGGGFEIPIGATTIAPLSSGSSLAFARTPDQVLHIVYAAPAGVVSKGGFFPNGLNGNITTTTA